MQQNKQTQKSSSLRYSLRCLLFPVKGSSFPLDVEYEFWKQPSDPNIQFLVVTST